MVSSFKRALFATAIFAVGSTGADAKTLMPSSLWAGTWQLNVGTSKLSSPAGKRSEVRVYALDGNNLTVNATGTDANGKPMNYSYFGPFDGKPHKMVGNPVGDSIALTLVTPLSANATVRKGSVVTATAKSNISSDGKHLTLTRTTLHGKAAFTTDVLAFDKK